jgi:translocation and assembly module TamB
LGLLVFLGLAAIGFARSELGLRLIADAIESAASTPGEFEIAIDRLEGSLPHEIRLSGVHLRDRDGLWLSIGSLALDWSPLALLSRRLQIDDLRLAGVVLERLPASADTEPSAGGGLPGIPVSIAANRVDVEDLTIGEAIIGQRGTFRIEGRAAASQGQEIVSELTIDRTDGVAGHTRLTAVFRPNDNHLSLNATIREPAAGSIAHLAGIPDLPAINASLEGEGALDDWRGALAIELDGLISVQSDIELLSGATLGVNTVGVARLVAPEAILPADVPAVLLAGDLPFGVHVTLDEDQHLAIEDTFVESAAVHVALAGGIALKSLILDAEVRVDLLDPALLQAVMPEFQGEDVTFSAHVVGPALQPRLNGRLLAKAVRVPGARVEVVDAEFSFAPTHPLGDGPPTGAIGSEGSLAGLTVDGQEALTPLLGSGVTWRLAGTLSGAADRVDLAALAVEVGPARLAASGAVDLTTDKIESAVTLELDDLTGLQPWLGMAPRGRAALDAWIESPDLGGTVTAIVTGELADIGLDDPILQAALGGTSNVAVDLLLASDGALAAHDFVLDTPSLSVAANVATTAAMTEVEADYAATVADLAAFAGPLGIDLAGGASLRGQVSGELANPDIRGTLALSDGRVNDITFDGVETNFAVSDVTEAPRGALDARAMTVLGEAELVTDFRFAAPTLELANLRARHRDATLDGALTIPIDGRPVSGDLRAAVPDLGTWLALAEFDGGGAAAAEIRLSGSGPAQTVEAMVRVTDPAFEVAPEQSLTAHSIVVDLTAKDVLADPSARIDLTADKIAIDEVALDTLSLTLDGGLEALDWAVSGTGAWRGPLVLAADGHLTVIDEREQSLAIKALQGTVVGRDVALLAPVTVSRAGDAARLGQLDLRFGDAKLSAEGRIDPDEVTARLGLESLSIASLSDLIPIENIDGMVDARLAIDGPRANPTGDAELHISSIDVLSSTDDPVLALALDATAAWRGERLAVNGAVTGLGSGANMSAEVPLRLDRAAFTPTVPPDGAIAADFSWQGDIATVWPFVPVVGHRMIGAIDVSGSVAGTISAPRLAGAVVIAGAEYENFESGTLLKTIDARIEMDETQIRLTQLSATDGGNGAVNASAEVAIDAGAGFPLRVDATLTDFTAVRRDEVNARLDGEVAITGSTNAMLVAGRFETKVIEIRIPDTMPPKVVDLGAIEAGSERTPSELASSGPAAEPEDPVTLDITVTMPRRVFVRGRGLDSEWSGDLTVTGPASAPVIAGEVNLVRGQLSLLSKTFRLTKGSVGFPRGAGPDVVPDIDVTAEHTANDVTAIVRVSGPVDDPSIELSSSPELPHDEIISTVLFGKTSGQLSALEAAQLAGAAAQLAGGGGGGGFMDSARQLVGVDVLRVGGTEDDGTGATSVEAGKYAAEGVYVGVKKGITEQTGSVAVEIEVTPNFSVKSETGVTGESDIGVEFKWDY